MHTGLANRELITKKSLETKQKDIWKIFLEIKRIVIKFNKIILSGVSNYTILHTSKRMKKDWITPVYLLNFSNKLF